MAKENRVALTPRDLDILTCLDRTPLTAKQLQTVSQSFTQPFTDESLVRRRLSRLNEAGFARPFPYSLVSDGRAPNYWKLTQNGYRVIYGADAILPGRRYFSEISYGNHVHSHAIASLISHLVACGHKHDIEMDQYARENSLKLEADHFQLYPDGAFRLRHRTQPERPYSFVLELDNGSERVRSTRDIESIERKIRGYDAHQSRYKRDDPDRYLVLFVTTRSEARLQHVLTACNALIRNPDRTLFMGATLSQLLDTDPYESPIVRCNNGLRRTLMPISISLANRKNSSQHRSSRPIRAS